MKPIPIQNNELKWILIDFDNTIVQSTGYPKFEVIGAKKGVRSALLKLMKKGYRIHVHTARPSSEYRDIETFLQEFNIPHHSIHTGKELGVMYIDDRGYRFNDWDVDIKNILDILKNNNGTGK